MKFVVFRVTDEIQASLLLESVRFGLTKLHGVEMSPAELRVSACSEIDERGVWEPRKRRMACVSLVRNEAGQVLVVWNERLRGYTLPGGKVEPSEAFYEAQARELREETGLDTVTAAVRYSAEHVDPDHGPFFTVVFDVTTRGELGPGEPGAPPRWISEMYLLTQSPFGEFYRKALAR